MCLTPCRQRYISPHSWEEYHSGGCIVPANNQLADCTRTAKQAYKWLVHLALRFSFLDCAEVCAMYGSSSTGARGHMRRAPPAQGHRTNPVALRHLCELYVCFGTVALDRGKLPIFAFNRRGSGLWGSRHWGMWGECVIDRKTTSKVTAQLMRREPDKEPLCITATECPDGECGLQAWLFIGQLVG